MNKKLKWLAAGLVVLGILGGAAPWTFSGEAMRSELALQIRETTGLMAEAKGRTTLALLPRPRIKIEEVTIQDREGKLLIKSGTMRGNLRILPVFAGRMEVSSLSLTAPSIDIDLDGKPLTSEGAIARAIEARSESREATAADTTRLASVSISNGAARLTRGGQVVSVLENIEATLDWGSLNQPAGLRASFIWASEPVDVTAWLGQPAQVLRGASSPVSFRLDSPSLNLSANGIVSGGQAPAYVGKFVANAPSLGAVLDRNNIYLPLPGLGRPLSLSADARASQRSIQLSDLQFKIDETAYEGAIILSSHRGRPTLMGTLATKLLQIDPLLTEVPTPRQSDGRWSGATLPKVDLGRADVDLRISATRAQIGRLQARDVGLSVLVAGGKAELIVVDAIAFGGAIKARLNAEPSEAGYALRASAAFSRVDSAAAMNDIFRSQRISGSATGELAFAGEGGSVAQVLSSLRGTAKVNLTDGDVTGLDLEQALRRLEKRPLSIASEMRSGRTAFSEAQIDLEIAGGVARVQTLEARSPGVDISVSGSASVARRLLDLTIKARQTGREDNQPAPQLNMDLRGNWDDPNLIIDAQSLIRRSEAAAPLLRSLNGPKPGGGAEPGKP
jgi:AsmA protein